MLRSNRKLSQFLFLVIFIEGYVVLASELLAIRLMMPFVGSGVEVVAIIVSAVLLPLAAGYHVGGQRYQRMIKAGAPISIRKLLLVNLTSALLVFTLGLSYTFLSVFFGVVDAIGIEHNLLQVMLYAGLFLVGPVFLLAQTVPLISNYYMRHRISEMTGRMLFFSTLGSFMGSIITTLILMNVIGVNMTVMVLIVILSSCIFILSKKRTSGEVLIAVGCMVGAWLLNSPAAMQSMHVVANNTYNTVQVREDAESGAVDLYLNHSYSSRYADTLSDRLKYQQYIENTVLQSAPNDSHILILGAGGFVLGVDDAQRRYTYVDIDGQLQDIAEEHLLPETLGQNKQFVAKSARRFLAEDETQYDIIVVDAFSEMIAVPLEVTTQEFWQEIQSHLRPDGVVAVNLIMEPTLPTRYAARMLNSFASVFPRHVREVVQDWNVWQRQYVNVILVHKDSPVRGDKAVYHDDWSPYSLDRYRR